MCQRNNSASSGAGFTLLELLLALTILSVVTAVTYLCFSTVTMAWKKGLALSDAMEHADFVMEQLVMGLRSAYYADASCGFTLENNGDGANSGDEIGWVKLGTALVGSQCPFSGSPHRVVFSVQKDREGKDAVLVKAWRLRGQLEDFKPEEVEPIPISSGVIGFNCRARDPESEDVKWLDDWEETNRIPTSVEVTLYMKPLQEGEEPVEIKRIVEIPVAPLAWAGWSAGASVPVAKQPATAGGGIGGNVSPTPAVRR